MRYDLFESEIDVYIKLESSERIGYVNRSSIDNKRSYSCSTLRKSYSESIESPPISKYDCSFVIVRLSFFVNSCVKKVSMSSNIYYINFNFKY
jgi:hypothetical protein